MRAERVVEEVSKELAERAGVDWDALNEEEREGYRQKARDMAEEIQKRLKDRRRKYDE